MDPIAEARELHRAGKLPEAIRRYEAILSGSPGIPEIWYLRATAEHDLGDLASAEAHWERAAALRPGWAPPHVELGALRMDRGEYARALEAFQAAVGADGADVRAWNNLGLALLALERLDDAARAFNQALSIDPVYAHANFNLARVLRMRGDDARATRHAEQAVRSDPALLDAHFLIADLQRKRQDLAAAGETLAAAARAAPGDVRARSSLAEHLAEVGHVDAAREEYARIAAAFPGNLKAALGENLLLPRIYHDADHVEEAREGYTQGLERLHEAAGRFQYRNAAEALAAVRWTNFFLAYQGREDKALQKRFGELVRRILAPVVPEWLAPRARGAWRPRIRVGFASHYFHDCTVGRYFASWVTRLNPARFETVVYNTNEWVDAHTRSIGAACAAYRHLPGRPIEALARRILADDLDILVYPELGMHPDHFTLGSLRLAPVQACGWGHPNTTGLPEIDWYLSCEAMEPEGAEAHYTERLALLPGLGTHYDRPVVAGAGTREQFGLPQGRTLYLVPQSLFKLLPDNDHLFAGIMARDPRGLLVFFSAPTDAMTVAFGHRLAAALARQGLLLEDRAMFLPYLPHADYLRLNLLCDVKLGARRWSGGNTSLDALASGLPIVTLPGALMRGRQSRAMLRILGLEEMIAASEDDYVRKALAMGTEAEARRAASERIVAGLPQLFGRDEPIRALEDFLERAVREAGK